MLRKKLSLILAATTLSFGLVACDGDDGDGDTGASASGTSGGESDSDESDSDESESESETNESESESETSNETDDTSDDSTTDDSAGDDTTGDDTSSDPCEGVMCADGEECVGGICVESDETDSGGGADANYPNPADGCPEGFADQGTYCAPPCDGAGMCPGGESGNSVGFCGLVTEAPSGTACEEADVGMECGEKGETCQAFQDAMGNLIFQCSPLPSHCILICEAQMMNFDCPDAMTCQVSGGQGNCVYQ